MRPTLGVLEHLPGAQFSCHRICGGNYDQVLLEKEFAEFRGTVSHGDSRGMRCTRFHSCTKFGPTSGHPLIGPKVPLIGMSGANPKSKSFQ